MPEIFSKYSYKKNKLEREGREREKERDGNSGRYEETDNRRRNERKEEVNTLNSGGV